MKLIAVTEDKLQFMARFMSQELQMVLVKVEVLQWSMGTVQPILTLLLGPIGILQRTILMQMQIVTMNIMVLFLKLFML